MATHQGNHPSHPDTCVLPTLSGKRATWLQKPTGFAGANQGLAHGVFKLSLAPFDMRLLLLLLLCLSREQRQRLQDRFR